MKNGITHAQREQDLGRLKHIMMLLSNAAEAIGAANIAIRQAKELASDIHDPYLRRKVMQAAGKLKASNEGFY